MSTVNVYNLSGQGGGALISGAKTLTGDFTCIQCVTDCTFSALTSNVSDPDSNLTSVTFPAGTQILGQHKSVGLATGSAIVYNA